MLSGGVATVGAVALGSAAPAQAVTPPPAKVGVTQRLLTAVEHSAFPGVTRLSDGRLALVWRQGAAHAGGTGGRIMWSTSDDLGARWTSPVVLAEDEIDDFRDPSIMRSTFGLHLTYFRTGGSGVRQLGAYTRRSDDGGATWGPEVRVDATSNAAITAPLVQLSSGRLLAFYYDSVPGVLNSTYQSRSDDGGLTWTGHRMLANGPRAGRHYNEPVVIRLPGARLVLFSRWGMNDGIARMVSGDGGTTWSAPEKVLSSASGRPAPLRLASGTLLLVARRPTGSGAAVVFTSVDTVGRSWKAPELLDIPGHMSTYAAPIEVKPGVVCCPFGSQTSPDVSALMVRYLVRGTAQTPFRETVRP
jgi:hypothetical protein